jgi:hypothetical protein
MPSKAVINEFNIPEDILFHFCSGIAVGEIALDCMEKTL